MSFLYYDQTVLVQNIFITNHIYFFIFCETKWYGVVGIYKRNRFRHYLLQFKIQTHHGQICGKKLILINNHGLSLNHFQIISLIFAFAITSFAKPIENIQQQNIVNRNPINPPHIGPVNFGKPNYLLSSILIMTS